MLRLRPMLLPLAVVAACGAPPRDPDAPKQYRAWCQTERKPISDWMEDREAVERIRRDHEKKFPHHITTLRTD